MRVLPPITVIARQVTMSENSSVSDDTTPSVCACSAGITRAQQEGGEAEPAGAEPERRGRDRVASQHRIGSARETVGQAPGETGADCDEAPDRRGKGQAAGHRLAEDGNPWHARETDGAPGPLAGVQNQEQRDLSETQSREREVMRGEAKRRYRDRRRNRERHQDRDRKTRGEIPMVARAQDRRRVCAQAEERALRQGEQARVAEDELVAEYEEHLAARKGQHAEPIGGGEGGRIEGEPRDQQAAERRIAKAAPRRRRWFGGRHARRPAASPNRPCGRSSRIASSAA